jgi:undecaprenyl-diphosphatase
MRPFVIAIGLLGVHVALGFAVHRHGALGIDRSAFDVVAHIRSRSGVDVVRVLTDIGSFPITAVAVAAAAFYAYRTDRPMTALALVAGFILTVILVGLTKDLWDRPRPANGLAGVSTLSYPSGHSAYAVAWLAAAAVTRRRALIAAAGVLVAAIGLSRLYLHVHYLTDVLGGAALSGAVFLAVLRRA